MEQRHRHGFSLRHALWASVTLAALIPAGAAADTVPSIDANTVVDVVFGTIPDGQTLEPAVKSAASKAATCNIDPDAVPQGDHNDYRTIVSCSPGVVTWTDSHSSLTDDFLHTSDSDAGCGQSGSACTDNGTLTPSFLPDEVTQYYWVNAYLAKGYVWAIPPSGCSASGNHLYCSGSEDYPGISSPVIVPRP